MAFINVSILEDKEVVPGINGRFVHTENITLAYWDCKAGAAMPEHSHPHEQVVIVANGEGEYIVDGEVKHMKKDDVAVIPGDVPHSGKAITDWKLIDVFYPVREDFK